MNPTYRFHQRQEGWIAACEIGERVIRVGFCPTEMEAREALNVALG